MVFGGFGKSWRRADHRKFYPQYYEGGQAKPLIGCHWEWHGESCLVNNIRYSIRKLEQVPVFIKQVRTHLQEWMELRGVNPTPNNYANAWREAWHPNQVQVWGRLAEEAEDSRAIEWLHQPYRLAIREARSPEGTIYKTSVTGQIGQIGRLWHRMYPVVKLLKPKDNPQQLVARSTIQYFELLTFFPNSEPDQQEKRFRHFLESGQKMFQLLWGN